MIEAYNIFDGETEYAEYDEAMRKAGWTLFLDVGSAERGTVAIQVYRRTTDSGDEFMAEVEGQDTYSLSVRTDSLPEMLDAVARWSSIVQAAALSQLEPVCKH